MYMNEDLGILCTYELNHLCLFLFTEAAAVVRQIAIATAHLHSLNIAHRDLKVQNGYQYKQKYSAHLRKSLLHVF